VTGNERTNPRTIGLLGVPSGAGGRQLGQELAPRHLRRAGVVECLRANGLEVDDRGDLPSEAFRPDRTNPQARNLASVVAVSRRVAVEVAEIARDGLFPVVLGGDCTVTIGVMAGMKTLGDMGLAYVDGDLDLNTPSTTPTGIFDGMGMAHLLGDGAPELAGVGSTKPLLADDHVVAFGYQEGWLDAVELAALERSAIARFPRSELGDDPAAAAERARSALEERCPRYVVHFDVDVVDHPALPVADVPHFGGLGLDEAERCLGVFLEGRAAALVVTEFNALQDPSGEVAADLVDRLARCLARSSSEATPSGAPDRKHRGVGMRPWA
jgi:arginase